MVVTSGHAHRTKNIIITERIILCSMKVNNKKAKSKNEIAEKEKETKM